MDRSQRCNPSNRSHSDSWRETFSLECTCIHPQTRKTTANFSCNKRFLWLVSRWYPFDGIDIRRYHSRWESFQSFRSFRENTIEVKGICECKKTARFNRSRSRVVGCVQTARFPALASKGLQRFRDGYYPQPISEIRWLLEIALFAAGTLFNCCHRGKAQIDVKRHWNMSKSARPIEWRSLLDQSY